MPEMLDIINENDEVIGQATKEEAHEKGLMHRFIAVFVFNTYGELLVQWRSRNKTRGPRIFDASVGGHVESGETYEQAAIRETEEELGLKDLEIKYLTDINDQKTDKENMKGKLYVAVHDGPYSNWEEEADALEFMSLDELKYMMARFPYLFTGGFQDAFTKYVTATEVVENKEE